MPPENNESQEQKQNANRQETVEILKQLNNLKPQTFDGYIDWIRHAERLKECDIVLYALRKNEVEKKVGEVIKMIHPKGIPSIDQLDAEARKLWILYSVCSFVNVNLCADALKSIEEQMQKKSPKEISAYLDGKIKSAYKIYDAERNQGLQEIYELIEIAVRTNNIKGFEKKGNEYFYNSEWKIENPGGETVVMRKIQNPNILIAIGTRAFIEVMEEGKVNKFCQEAEENYKDENREMKKETLDNFDLPKDQKVKYLRIFPGEYDEVTSTEILTSIMMTGILKKKYSQMDIAPIIFTNDPISALTPQLIEAYKNGTRYFSIDFFSHGSENALLFDKEIKAEDLKKLMERFPDAIFTFGTNACFGGGLREGMMKIFEKNPGLAGRMNIFLQTKPNIENKSAVVSKTWRYNDLGLATSYYHLQFIKAMNEGKTYGQAARIADIETKKHIHIDAEAMIYGDLITIQDEADEIPDDLEAAT